MRKFVAILALAVALGAAGCGDSEPSEVTAESSAETREASSKPLFAIEMSAEGREWLRAAAAATHQKRGIPRWEGLEKAAGPQAQGVVLPHGSPPKGVVFKDLRVGRGARLEPGDIFGVTYTSFDYKTGGQEQKSYNGSAALYAYGVGELVKAWEPGLRGMRAGGVRELVVPGAWAYGSPVVYLVRLVTVEKEG